MIEQFTEEEQTEIRVAIDHLERMNNARANEVLEAINLLFTMIEEKTEKIVDLEEQLDDRLKYIEDWQLY